MADYLTAYQTQEAPQGFLFSTKYQKPYSHWLYDPVFNWQEIIVSDKYNETWEKYVASWGAESSAEKRALYQLCLDSAFEYNDPLIKTKGWDELIDYMMDFKKQIPGGHFVTTYFLAHSHKSIARWEMRNGENVTLSEGISYGEHNEEGRLVSETGFFEPPES